MKRVLPWLLTTALLAAAWLVAYATPGDQAAYEPFRSGMTIGEESVGHGFAVTVLDARHVRSVVADGGWADDGDWILVDVEAESTRTQVGTMIGGATLVIGDRTFRASERMTSMFRAELVPGISRTGTLAFELPADALGSDAVLQLSASSDPRGDSLFELPIVLGELPVEDEGEIRSPDWTNP